MHRITAAQFADLREEHDRLLIVNALPARDFRDTAIDEAISVPEEDGAFVAHVARAMDAPNQPIVVYSADADCDCSINAATKLDQAGFQRVYELTGGAKAWRSRQGCSHDCAPPD